MANYVEEQLLMDEEIVVRLKKSPFLLYLARICLILTAVIAIIFSIGIAVKFSSLLTGLDAEEELIFAGMIYAEIAGVIIVSWLFFLGVGLTFFFLFRHVYRLSDLALTNRRLMGKTGVFTLKAFDIPVNKIDHVEIGAGFLGNKFNYFSLNVQSVGGASSKQKTVIPGVANAEEFKNAVTIAIEQHADEARKAQAEDIANALRSVLKS